MARIDVECPECAEAMDLDEGQVGQSVKCPKCKFVFEAQPSQGAYGIGGDYGLAGDNPGTLPGAQAPPSGGYGLLEDQTPRPRPTRSGPAPARKPQPKPARETEEDRRLRERMEKWADEMD